jgi:hypothetical protein
MALSNVRREWLVSAIPRPLYPRDKVPIVHEATRASGPVWMGTKKLASTRMRTPDRPPFSEALYRLCYFGLFYFNVLQLILGFYLAYLHYVLERVPCNSQTWNVGVTLNISSHKESVKVFSSGMN